MMDGPKRLNPQSESVFFPFLGMYSGRCDARAIGVFWVLVAHRTRLADGLWKIGKHKSHEDCDDRNHHKHLDEGHPLYMSP